MYRRIVFLSMMVSVLVPSCTNGFFIQKSTTTEKPAAAPVVYLVEKPLEKIGSIEEPKKEYGLSPSIPTPIPTTEEPLFKKQDWTAFFDAVKDRVNQLNPFTKIYNYFKNGKPIQKPEYKFVPALGFTEYKKVKYFPVVETEKKVIKPEEPKPEEFKPEEPKPEGPYPAGKIA